MQAHLNGVRPTAGESSAEERAGNKRDGLTQKTFKTEFGPLTVDVSRDRNSSFDPVVAPKHCRSFGKIDEQIITMYSRGMSARDIQAFVENLYGVNISPDYVSTVTDRVLEEMQEWTSRLLESVYPVVFFLARCASKFAAEQPSRIWPYIWLSACGLTVLERSWGCGLRKMKERPFGPAFSTS